jgi:intracellular multiplication protein IcmL
MAATDNNKSLKSGKDAKRSALDAFEGNRKDAIETLFLRNYAVYVLYRKTIFIGLMAIFLAIVSALLAFTFLTQKIPPQYVQLDEQGRLLIEQPLEQKDRQDGEVLAFALSAVKKLNTYDYINIKDQLNQSSDSFTPNGWTIFMKNYGESKTMDMVEAGREIVTSEAIGDPSVVHSGIIQGVQLPDGAKASVYAWKVDIPFQITFIAHSGDTQSASGYSGQTVEVGVLHLLITRIPANILPRGIGIASYNFELKKTQ